MNVTILYSISRQRDARRMTDVHFNPPLDRVGLLEWSRFDSIVQQSYEPARAVLAMPAVIERLKGHRPLSAGRRLAPCILLSTP